MYGAMDESSSTTWECAKCTFLNPPSRNVCEMCLSVDSRTNTWSCTTCTFVQSLDSIRCEMCGAPRPGASVAIDIEPEPLVRQVSDLLFRPQPTRPVREFYCAICMSSLPETQKATLACPHEYCKGCIEQFVTLAIKEARVLNITCPGQKEDGSHCDAPVSPKDIKEIVDEKNWEKYERFVKMKMDDSYVSCPKCNQLQKGSRLSPMMHCERKDCAAEFCFFHSGAHVGETCSQYKKRTKQDFKRDLAFVQETAIICPNMCCRTPISKVSGCNHMTCTQCGAEFCYLCGGWYMLGLHFSEYNCLGCPDMQSAGGEPNSRATCQRQSARCVGWPFMLLCCSIPLALLFALFACFEACWFAFIVLCCPCIVIYKYRVTNKRSHAAQETFKQWVCAGPVACGVLIRGCGCGFPCHCCLRTPWQIGRAVQQECRDRSRMPSSA
eukprot:TRINITY_DN4765_c0_g1_i4.p1 TRINITY_DN4765_c0_g1~~TRINITY_DN4765_c0_g1_i4.p1  ORF type:complete len:439 (-),score=-0.43 TRINITY_DN4765_c0_g1_i4:10-1326(-)